MRVSSYLPLPKELKAKRGCLNIQNNDENCFLWSILTLLHPVQCKNYPDRISKYQEYKRELNVSLIKYPLYIKGIIKFQHQSNINVNVYAWEWKKNVLVTHYQHGHFQDITWIYYISLLTKHFITYWWKTWPYLYQDNVIITTTKNIFANIVYMAAPVKRYWKTIWKDASYSGHKESSSHNLTTRKGMKNSSLQKRNTNYVYLMSSTPISKAFYVNKTRVSHRHRNPSPPNTSITYNIGAASTRNAVIDNTLNFPKWI